MAASKFSHVELFHSCPHTCPHKPRTHDINLKKRPSIYIEPPLVSGNKWDHLNPSQNQENHPHCNANCPAYGSKPSLRASTHEEILRAIPVWAYWCDNGHPIVQFDTWKNSGQLNFEDGQFPLWKADRNSFYLEFWKWCRVHHPKPLTSKYMLSVFTDGSLGPVNAQWFASKHLRQYPDIITHLDQSSRQYDHNVGKNGSASMFDSSEAWPPASTFIPTARILSPDIRVTPSGMDITMVLESLKLDSKDGEIPHPPNIKSILWILRDARGIKHKLGFGSNDNSDKKWNIIKRSLGRSAIFWEAQQLDPHLFGSRYESFLQLLKSSPELQRFMLCIEASPRKHIWLLWEWVSYPTRTNACSLKYTYPDESSFEALSRWLPNHVHS